MYRLLQKHSKKILAVLGVFLMIVFIIPTAGQRMASDYAVGEVAGGEEITAREVQAAAEQWNVLARTQVPDQMFGQQPLPDALIVPGITELVARDPVLYVLLLREAERLGAAASQDDVSQLLTALVPETSQIAARERQAFADALSNLLAVRAAFRTAGGVVKVSDPEIRRALADAQLMRVRLAEVDAEAFADQVPAPTPEQLEAQFAAHADVAPGQTDPETNPFGFAYRFPDRVKLQTIQIPREQVRQAVRGERTEYQWEVEARKYYQQNRSQFPATAPSTQPTTGPAVRPFEEVRERVIERVLEPLVDRRMAEIRSVILTRLNQDRTRLSPNEYQGFEYLSGLAQAVQEQTGVLPTVASLGDEFRSQQQLIELDGIGLARSEEFGPFASYAVTQAAPLAPVGTPEEQVANMLEPYEPSAPLTDLAGNVYVFRLTDVSPAHRPEGLSEVAGQVEADWRRLQQFELAEQRAQELLEAARAQGLEPAAQEAGLTVTTTGEFRAQPGSFIPGYTLSPESSIPFMEQIPDILTAEAGTGTPPPTTGPAQQLRTLIELPGEGKVLVAELVEVRAPWTQDDLATARTFLEQQIREQQLLAMAAAWFTAENVRERTGYVATREEPGADAQPTAPAAPPRRPLGI